MNKRPYSSLSGALHWGALEIAAVYLIVGSAWILFSDQVATRIAPNKEMLATISLYKGWGYVFITALLLYWLIRRHTARLHTNEQQLQRVLDAMPALISYVDSDRHIQYANEAYREWFGEKAAGKHMQEALGEAAYQDLSAYVDRVLKGETTHFETELSYHDGEERYLNATYIPDVAANGHTKGFFVLVQDMTERKQAEEELRLWADAFEGCAHGVAICDPNTNRILVCNPAFAKMHKSRVEAIAGSAILSLYAPPDHEHVRHHVQKADQIGHASFEAKMIRTDRSTFPVQMDLVSVFGEDGEVLHRVVTAQDISERKQAEEKIMHQARLLEQVNDAVIATDEHFVLTSWNPAAERIYGWKAEEVIGRRGEEVLKTEFFNQSRSETIQELKDKGKLSAEVTQARKDGFRVHIEARTVAIRDDEGHITGYVSVNRDITKRKQIEEEIKSLARFPAENPNPVLRATHDGKLVYANAASAPLLGDWGTKVGNYLPDPWIEMIEGLSQTGSGKTIDVQFGETTYSIMIVYSPNANDVNMYGRDITERKRAEEALRRFELISQHSRDIILFMGHKDGRILEASAAALQAYGYSRDELLALTIQDLRAPDTQNLTADQMAQANAGGILFETIHRRKDGSTFPVEVSSQGATIAGVRTLISIIRDITERRQSEEALRLKDQLLRLTSEMAKVGGWEFDPYTGKGAWTDEVARIHDLDPEQETNLEIGLSFYEGESQRKVEQAVKDAVELAKPYDLELEMVTAKGNRKWVRTMALPIVQDRKVVKVQGIFQDITERKQIEKALQVAHDELELKVQQRTAALSEANALLQALMDNMPDHIYFKDRQGRFIRNSRSQARLLGLNDPAEAVGKSDFDFFPHAARSYAEEQEVMRSGAALMDEEEWVVWPDGRETWVLTTKLPLRDSQGETIGIFGISRDITERKRNEQAIRQLNADLETQAKLLQAANKELEAFSYSVSHDLRAPLRAIDGYTRILVEDYEPLLDDEGKRICGVISREARRMGQLIDDLLAFSRLGRKEMYSSRIDMKALVVSVLNEILKEEDRQRTHFKIARLAPARADSSLMRQAWVNLLSNAIKFTSKTVGAVIEVGCKSTRDEYIYFVRDNGAGFDMEYANKLFGVFQRLHSESEFEGTGVGLAIVQRVIRRHGGRVWAEGEVQKGATFYFSLPRKENLS